MDDRKKIEDIICLWDKPYGLFTNPYNPKIKELSKAISDYIQKEKEKVYQEGFSDMKYIARKLGDSSMEMRKREI